MHLYAMLRSIHYPRMKGTHESVCVKQPYIGLQSVKLMIEQIITCLYKLSQNLYSLIRSYTELMNKVLSPAYFIQFGISGLMICATVYLMSAVSLPTTEASHQCSLENGIMTSFHRAVRKAMHSNSSDWSVTLPAWSFKYFCQVFLAAG